MQRHDDCAVIGSSDKTITSNDVLTALVVGANKIDDWELKKVTTSWSICQSTLVEYEGHFDLIARERDTQILLSFDRL